MFFNIFRNRQARNESNDSFSMDRNFGSSTKNEIVNIQNKLGTKIKFKHELGDSYTPQKVSNAAWAGLTVGVACLNPFFAIPIGLIGILNYFQEDYDSPENRSKLMIRIANESFEKIARSHSIENVIGYQLLNKISLVRTSDLEQRACFYASFQRLAKEFNRLNEWHNHEKAQIEKKWSKAIEEISGKNADIFSEPVRLAISPWNKWKDAELSKIQSVYQINIKILNGEFRNFFH